MIKEALEKTKKFQVLNFITFIALSPGLPPSPSPWYIHEKMKLVSMQQWSKLLFCFTRYFLVRVRDWMARWRAKPRGQREAPPHHRDHRRQGNRQLHPQQQRSRLGESPTMTTRRGSWRSPEQGTSTPTQKNLWYVVSILILVHQGIFNLWCYKWGKTSIFSCKDVTRWLQSLPVSIKSELLRRFQLIFVVRGQG